MAEPCLRHEVRGRTLRRAGRGSSRFLRPLICLDALPEPRRCARGTFGRATEHVRVTPDHLGGYGLGHISKCKGTLLLRYARVIDHLQQQIAQFVLQLRHVSAFDGVGDLVGFFDGVGSYGPERLFQVPRTTGARCPERGHDGQQIGDRFSRLVVHSAAFQTSC